MRTRHHLALLAALAVVALAALVAGCGGDDDEPEVRAGAAANAIDAAFVADMTTHHQDAIEMARTAAERAEHPEIEQLAGEIVAAQEREVGELETVRSAMGEMEMHEDAHMDLSEAERGMDMDPGGLEHADPFDRAFIDMMIPHHEGAIRMAREELAKGENPTLRSLAEDIVAAQEREIAQMREWREAWYGSAGGSGESMHGSEDSMHGER